MIYKKDPTRPLQSILGFSDGSWRWSAGVQGSIATALPLAVFTLTGHQSLGLIASLGAFTVLYGSALGLGERLRALPLVATGFVTASVLGVLCATNVPGFDKKHEEAVQKAIKSGREVAEPVYACLSQIA